MAVLHSSVHSAVRTYTSGATLEQAAPAAPAFGVQTLIVHVVAAMNVANAIGVDKVLGFHAQLPAPVIPRLIRAVDADQVPLCF